MFENVLVGVDGRVSGRDAIALAAQLTQPGGAITLAYVQLPYASLPAALQAELVAAQELLEKEREQAGIDAELAVVEAESPGRGLHEEAERRHADLLVLGTCRHGILGRTVLGNNTRRAINGAPCAIAVAPLGYAEHATPIRTIGVGYDCSPEAEGALETAKQLAARIGAKVRARQVVSLRYSGVVSLAGAGLAGVGFDDVIEEAQKHMNSLPGVQGDAVCGFPSEELATLGSECDLLIVGSRGYGPLQRVVHGSTSRELQSRARGPLMILPRGTRYSQTDSTERHQRESVPA